MEESNNQGAPAAEVTDNAPETTNSPDAAGTQAGAENTTNNAPQPEQPAFDPRTNYDALVKQFEGVNKSYGELRRESTRWAQERNELKRSLESLSKAFTEATRQEISPEEFKKSLETQGIKAFDPLRKQWAEELQAEHQKALLERDNRIDRLMINQAIMSRRLDTKNYPDFGSLEQTMQQIADDPNCTIDFNNGDVDLIYDTLYKLARDLKAEESVKQAKAIGRKEAESQAAKEASTAVAAGGKTNTVGIDPRNMSAADLKKHFTKLGMVSD